MPTQVSGRSNGEVARSLSRRRLVALAVGATALATTGLLAGCGSGQVAQTAGIVPAVPGANGDVKVAGGQISVRDVTIDYPGQQGYQAGQDAPLSLRVINGTTGTVTLTGASALVAPTGNTSVGTVVQVGGAASAAPSAESPVPRPSSPSPAAKSSARASTHPAASTSASASTSESSTPSASPSPSGPAGNSAINVPVPAAPDGLIVLSKADSGGTYLTISGLAKALSAGDTVRLVLTFTLADGSTVQIGSSTDAADALVVPVAVPDNALPRSPLSLSPAAG